jgi:D-alanine-D-alanine ligase
VDLRLTESGEIYVIEVNASCYLEQQGEFAMAAAAHGIEYPALISRIVEVALERWQRPEGSSNGRRHGRASRKARADRKTTRTRRGSQ